MVQARGARRADLAAEEEHIPKDSDNWFNEWFPSATKSINVVCFITAAYLRSPYCMKEFGIALAMDKLLVVACEPIAQITSVDATEFPHASNALAYLMGGGQVIFHDTDDVESEIMKFIPLDADAGTATPEPEPSGALGMPPAHASPMPSGGADAVAAALGASGTVADLLASARLTAYETVFSSEGYEFVEDLLDAETKDLEELMTMLGIKKPERKRFERALALSAGSSGGSSGDSAEDKVDEGGVAEKTRQAEAAAAEKTWALQEKMAAQAEALSRQQSALDRQAADAEAGRLRAAAAATELEAKVLAQQQEAERIVARAQADTAAARQAELIAVAAREAEERTAREAAVAAAALLENTGGGSPHGGGATSPALTVTHVHSSVARIRQGPASDTADCGHISGVTLPIARLEGNWAKLHCDAMPLVSTRANPRAFNIDTEGWAMVSEPRGAAIWVVSAPPHRFFTCQSNPKYSASRIRRGPSGETDHVGNMCQCTVPVVETRGEWGKLHPAAWRLCLGSSHFKKFDIHSEGWILLSIKTAQGEQTTIWQEDPSAQAMSGAVFKGYTTGRSGNAALRTVR